MLSQFNTVLASPDAVQYMQLVTEPGAPFSLTAVQADQLHDRELNFNAALDGISGSDLGGTAIGNVAYDVLYLGNIVNLSAGQSPSYDGGYAQHQYPIDLNRLRTDIATARADLISP
jgi:hypothetical protein